MRLRLRWLAAAAAAGLLWWQWPAVVNVIDQARELAAGAKPDGGRDGGWKLAKVRESLVGEVFLLEPDRWLTFELPPGQSEVRLLTNAELPETRRPEFGTPIPDLVAWTYAVRIQLLDSGGDVLEEREEHFQTRLSEFVDPELETTVTPAFYLGEPVIPTDSRLAVIPLAGHAVPPARLRVRLLRLDDPLTGLAVRVSYRDPVAEHQLSYFWQRMFADRQRKMARGNVHGPDLLTEEEKANLLRHRWSPLAPSGRPGDDYRQRSLYVLTEAEGELVRDRPPPAGTLAEPGRVAVIPVPEEGGRVRFVFTSIGLPVGDRSRAATPGESPHGGSIELRWYGLGSTERETFHVPWDGREARFERELPGGTVEVHAPDAISVRAFRPGVRTDDRRRPTGSEEITPIPSYTWTYLVRGAGPVEFDVLHVDAEATPLRVDVRGVASEPDLLRTGRPNPRRRPPDVPPVAVPYQFLGAEGAVLVEGELASELPGSSYDRAQMLRQEFGVSDPTTHYFSAPPQAVKLRFPATDAAAAVTVYNRPGGLPTVTLIPEDYYEFDRAEAGQRNWFLMRAVGHDDLELANRVPAISVQPRPPEVDPEVAAGRFEWYEFLPEGNWRARPLLVPRDPESPFRAEALPTTYVELASGRDVRVRFLAQPGRRQVVPSLAYVRDGEKPLTVRVFVGGRLHHEARVDGSRGELQLPPVAVPTGGATMNVRLTASVPARLFLNYVAPGTGPAVVKRTAVRIAGSPLEFEYEKLDRAKRSNADELLSFTLHRPAGAADRAQVAVRIDRTGSPAIGPFATWTFRHRVYDVRPAGGDRVPVLGTREMYVDQGRPFFLPVGEDLPPGRYRVHVESLGSFEAYLLFSRSTPGAYESREFFVEQPARGESAAVEREP